MDLASGREFPVCVAPGDQVAPRVDGKIAVWQDGRRDPQKCRGTAPPRTESPQDPFPVRLPGDEKPKPSEAASTEDAAWCVLASDLTTGQTMFVGGELGPAVEPDIDGPVIVWRERILGDWDIMMLHLALPVSLMVTCDLSPDYQPSVWGDRIAWVTREGARESINLLWWVVPAEEGITASFAGSLLGKLIALPGSDPTTGQAAGKSPRRGFRLVDRDTIARDGLKPCPVCHPPEQQLRTSGWGRKCPPGGWSAVGHVRTDQASALARGVCRAGSGLLTCVLFCIAVIAATVLWTRLVRAPTGVTSQALRNWMPR